MIKIAFFDTKPYDEQSFMRYADRIDAEFKFYETRLTADTVSLTKGCDAVCVFVNDCLDSEVIDRLAGYGVRVVALRCAGYNNVDIKHAKGRVRIFHVPAYSPHAVAEHAMALLLTSVRRIHKAYIRTRDFNFSLSGLTGFDLYQKTVGVIGTGRIGRVFADICKGFGMKVVAYDKYQTEGYDYIPLDELMRTSDIISLHCPLTEETHHIIDASAIERMKRGVVLINTSRGALVDADALLRGIKSRKVGAACLDVYEEESEVFFEDFSGHIMDDDTLARLISMPNVIVTSHQAFLTAEALDNIAATTVDNLKGFFENQVCQNEISV